MACWWCHSRSQTSRCWACSHGLPMILVNVPEADMRKVVHGSPVALDIIINWGHVIILLEHRHFEVLLNRGWSRNLDDRRVENVWETVDQLALYTKEATWIMAPLYPSNGGTSDGNSVSMDCGQVRVPQCYLAHNSYNNANAERGACISPPVQLEVDYLLILQEDFIWEVVQKKMNPR